MRYNYWNIDRMSMEYNGILMEDVEIFADLHGILDNILRGNQTWLAWNFPAVHV